MRYFYRTIAIVLILTFLSQGCSKGEKVYSREWVYFGTVVGIKFYATQRPPDKLFDTVKRTYAYWDSLTDFYDRNSALYKLNREIEETVVVDSNLSKLICEALRWKKLTHSKLTPLIGPLVRLWGIGKKGKYIPDKYKIDSALSYIETCYVKCISDTIMVLHGRPVIDLSAYAKGWVVDRIYHEILPIVRERKDIRGFIIDAGRNLRVWRRDGGTYKIGISNPRGKGIIKVFELPSGMSCASAGDYEQFFIVDGKRYHHIFDPMTGYPASGAIAATAICVDGIDADALSTAAVVIGRDCDDVAKRVGCEVILFEEVGKKVVSSLYGTRIVRFASREGEL